MIFAGTRVRVVKKRHSPNRDRFARLSADSRHCCFDHATRRPHWTNGLEMSTTADSAFRHRPQGSIIALSSFHVLPTNPSLDSRPHTGEQPAKE